MEAAVACTLAAGTGCQTMEVDGDEREGHKERERERRNLVCTVGKDMRWTRIGIAGHRDRGKVAGESMRMMVVVLAFRS